MLKVVLLLLFICTSATIGASGVCSVEGIDNLNRIHKSDKVIADDYEGVIEKFLMKNLDSAYMEDTPYLKADIFDGYIAISTTPEFAEIEDREGEIPITATLVTVCGAEENRLKYTLNLEDTNNHSPKFEKDSYNYVFYDVIPNTNEFNLNEFEEIAARDVDFSNHRITFEIEENDYLKLEDTGLRDDGDLYRFVANVVLKQDVTAPFNKTFVITATDSGKSPLSGTADVIVTILRSEAPIFTKPLYEAYVNKERQIIVEDGDIALENVTRLDDIRFDISSDYEEFFELEVTDVLKLKLSEDQDISSVISKEDSSIIIDIYAEGHDRDIYAEASVLLNLEALFDNLIGDIDDSTENNDQSTLKPDDSKEDESEPDTVTFPEFTTVSDDKTTLKPGFVYTELRGFSYWLDVNKTTVILFSVLTGCAVLVFFCIVIRKRNARIS